jgi:adenylate kinase family enzyme
MKQNSILVLDGHDGAGKTTLATRLAKVLGGVHVRPFSGEVGEQLIWSAKHKKYSSVSVLGRKAIKNTLATHDSRNFVFDRHWMTIFTLVPEQFWEDWMPLPPTALCWVDFDTTINRLKNRIEKKVNHNEHKFYLKRYVYLARRFRCKVIKTDQMSVDSSLEQLVAWANLHLNGSCQRHFKTKEKLNNIDDLKK